MPGKVKLSSCIDKKDFEEIMPGLRTELGELQRAIYKSAIPVMIVFEGLEASGKSEMVKELLKAMDPRCFRVHPTGEPTEEESLKPFMWRFWKRIPPGGRIDIYDQSWYGRFLAERAGPGKKKKPMTPGREQKIIRQIADFERQLATDQGSEEAKPYLIIKIFLDIDKKEQKRRLVKLEGVEAAELLFDRPDWKAYKHHDEDRRIFDRVIKLTDQEYARWNITDACDRRFATVKVYEVVRDALRKRLEETEQGYITGKRKARSRAPGNANCPVLDQVDLSRSLPEDEYHARLKSCQEELAWLQYKAHKKNVPVVIVFEGMDAAGKGGSIKRLSESFDPRGYRVVPTGVPDAWEQAHHYLWRFWIHFPPKGYITIFDRSWYGRVLVERIEGLTPEKCWRQAYDEINQTEEALYDNGTAIAKFWLHITPEVEYERLKARENDPAKSWKVDPHDWKDHSHWDAYMAAAEEMICHTGTSRAPWTIVPSNDKLFSRIMVMETVIDTIKKAL
jgi:AMP-polyphosphate phosphotransferase